MKTVKNIFKTGVFGLSLCLASSLVLAAGSGEGHEIKPQNWTFKGSKGHYDNAQLQRGFQVYKEVCSSCHGLKFLSYRNLSEKGGPEFTPDQVKAVAAEFKVTDGPNDEGEMFERPGKPSDHFVSPFKNEQAARAANNGAYPPDLSVITKARSVHRNVPWYSEPLYWIKDITSGYQEGGSDYLYALLTGYVDAPKETKDSHGKTVPFVLQEGMNYNKYFPGNQIAMAKPLSDGAVTYSDGSPQTVEQYAKDVTAFLSWAADPKLEQRKQLGLHVLIYLLVTALVLYLAKKAVWSRLKH